MSEERDKAFDECIAKATEWRDDFKLSTANQADKAAYNIMSNFVTTLKNLKDKK